MTVPSINGEVCFPSSYNVPLGLNKTHCFPWGQSLIAYNFYILNKNLKNLKEPDIVITAPLLFPVVWWLSISEQMLFCVTKIPSLCPQPIRTSYLTLVKDCSTWKLGNHITINSSLSPKSEISVLHVISYHLWKMEQNAM